jgi:hypothetical protein
MSNFCVWVQRALACGAVMLGTLPCWGDPVVVNGDFESATDGFVVWPGYVGNGNPDDVSGWVGSGGRGVNPIASAHASPAPFRDNGDNNTHVAFLQGNAYIEQTVSGFMVGGQYVLGLDFNARNCCGDLPIGTITLNGIEAGSSTDIFPPPGTIVPAGGNNPWYHADIPFQSPTTEITLRITAAPGAGGDSTMLVDNLSFTVVPEPSSLVLLLLGALPLTRRTRRA